MKTFVHIKSLAAVSVAGADARNYLQGQLTADLDTLTHDNVLLAACNSPQGRVQAVVWLVQRTDGIALLVDRELLDQTLARLRRYVLRAKVTFTADSLAVAVGEHETFPEGASHRQIEERSHVRLPGHSQALALIPNTTPMDSSFDADEAWALAHLRAGLPRLAAQTHEQFVAQMLNLDLLGGISFEKGCYTGQEIIARTHFRGAIKRRMFRFGAKCPPPSPGTRVLAGEQHAGDVVNAVAVESGCELLVVATLTQADQALTLETNPGVPLERLSLPYSIPLAPAA
jgi:folate-binding protein YgfZ